ncbi:MAG: diaminopimelate decarboxylase [Chitinophagales bacterium]|nr:diaminopimelate decarboxylase [Chitinophagales bacterium]
MEQAEMVLDNIRICEEFGTPLFVYNEDKMKSQYHKFVNAFDVPALRVHYACKALSNINVLRLFKDLGSGLDCVSLQEVQLGLKAGFKPEDILYTPNNVSEDEYKDVIDLGVKINVDNLQMLECLGVECPHVPVCIRINPHLMAGGNRNISVGHIDSKFGISIHQLPLIQRIVNSLNIDVEGIHVHTGSDIIDSEIFIKAAELVFAVVEKFDSVKYVDFGSGFKIKYKEGDLSTDIDRFGELFSKVFIKFSKDHNKDYELKFEPGKFLVSEAGDFFTKVNVVKQTTSCTFIGVDSGFNHLIRPMFYNAHHEIENISNPNGAKKVYSVVGYICETDTFASDRLISEVRTGDILRFKNSGAYCFSMASNYNSRFRPAEVLLSNGEPKLIRKRETLDDLLRNQIY